MRFNSKSERNLAFEQALLRYDIIKKGLLKISKEELSSAQETTLEELDEMSGVVKQLSITSRGYENAKSWRVR